MKGFLQVNAMLIFRDAMKTILQVHVLCAQWIASGDIFTMCLHLKTILVKYHPYLLTCYLSFKNTAQIAKLLCLHAVMLVGTLTKIDHWIIKSSIIIRGKPR